MPFRGLGQGSGRFVACRALHAVSECLFFKPCTNGRQRARLNFIPWRSGRRKPRMYLDDSRQRPPRRNPATARATRGRAHLPWRGRAPCRPAHRPIRPAVSGRNSATPAEMVTESSTPSQRKRPAPTRLRARSTRASRCASPLPVRITPNSSPPSRATRFRSPKTCRRIAEISWMTMSPTWWPKRSLISLKRSMTMIASDASPSTRAKASLKARRLASPDRVSVRLSRSNSARDCVRSRITRPATKASAPEKAPPNSQEKVTVSLTASSTGMVRKPRP